MPPVLRCRLLDSAVRPLEAAVAQPLLRTRTLAPTPGSGATRSYQTGPPPKRMKTLPRHYLSVLRRESQKRVPDLPKAREHLELTAESVKATTNAGTVGDAERSGDSTSEPPDGAGRDARQRLLFARVQRQFQRMGWWSLMHSVREMVGCWSLVGRVEHSAQCPSRRELVGCWSLVHSARDLGMVTEKGYNGPIMLNSSWLEELEWLPRPLEGDGNVDKLFILRYPQFPTAPCRGMNELRTREGGPCQVQLDKPSTGQTGDYRILREIRARGGILVRYRRAAQLLKNRHVLKSSQLPLLKKYEDHLEAIIWAGPITEPCQTSAR